MKRVRERLKPKVYIELTPLVDVIFILLIFFIFSYNKLQVSSHKISLPDASEGEKLNLAKEGTLDIYLYKDGSLFIGNSEVSLSGLGIFLKDYISEDEDLDIVINTEGGASIQSLISLMDEIKLSGFKKSPYVKTADSLK